MFVDVLSVQPLDGHKLHLEFEDGVSGTVNVKDLVDFTGVFEYLRDEEQFSMVTINAELGVVCWPNGADLDSDVLYSIITGQPIPDFEELNRAL
ncbi:MAG: DUF2442 domain-containing protein [Anaerolineales bacterium]|nr:DUF2442 domain-containing protein [Anaerolineales bacterium]